MSDLNWTEQDREATAEEMNEEIKRRIAIAREALFLVRLDDTLQPNGKMCRATMDKVEEAFGLLS